MAGISFGVGVLEILKKGSDTPVEVGILQNVSIDISTSQAELRGGGSLLPVAVAITERSITGSAEFAQIDGALLGTLLGADMETVGNTVTINDNTEPFKFKLTLQKPSDGSGIQLELFECVSTSLGFSFAYDNFTIPSFDFTAMADANGNVMKITL